MGPEEGAERAVEKVLVCWSGGKDSCMALHEMLNRRQHKVVSLLTTVTGEFNRISMHGVRDELLTRQAQALGLPVHRVYLTPNATNDEYEAKMKDALLSYRSTGVNSVVFGDLFLEDIKSYRDRLLAELDMTGLYPVWRRDTTEFIRDFLGFGFKAIVSCVNATALGASFAGRVIDTNFLEDLPAGVDPCGENGEFHTFVYGGPIFASDVKFTAGETALRNGHYYCDLLPEE